MTTDLVELRARLASLQRRPARVAAASGGGERIPAGFDRQDTPAGWVAVRHEWIAGHREAPAPQALARCLAIDRQDLQRPVFLDTETTGLSGGTGTVAFLVGVAWPHEGGLVLSQFFLCDLDQERALLWAVGEALRPHRTLVTYNGRSFDWPLLQTRLTMTRQAGAWPVLPHLDLLHLVRRLFTPRLPNCTLQTVEAALLHLAREEDLPGALIPAQYFGWLRGGSQAPLERVMAHNRQDVLSLADVLALLEQGLGDGALLHPMDRFARARFLESRGWCEEALDEYRTLWRTFNGPLRGALGIRLARMLCRRGEWREARAVLEECWRTQCYPYPAAVALAKVLEHQAGDPLAARRLVGEALALLGLAAVADDRWRRDLERRRLRLDHRLKARSAGGLLRLTG